MFAVARWSPLPRPFPRPTNRSRRRPRLANPGVWRAKTTPAHGETSCLPAWTATAPVAKLLRRAIPLSSFPSARWIVRREARRPQPRPSRRWTPPRTTLSPWTESALHRRPRRSWMQGAGNPPLQLPDPRRRIPPPRSSNSRDPPGGRHLLRPTNSPDR